MHEVLTLTFSEKPLVTYKYLYVMSDSSNSPGEYKGYVDYMEFR